MSQISKKTVEEPGSATESPASVVKREAGHKREGDGRERRGSERSGSRIRCGPFSPTSSRSVSGAAIMDLLVQSARGATTVAPDAIQIRMTSSTFGSEGMAKYISTTVESISIESD